MASAEPDSKSFDELSTKVKDLTPEAVGTETWYLIIATILTASPAPTLLGPFWTYLTTSPSSPFTSPSNQPQLSLRLRDTLLKLVTLIGAPPVVVAVSALAKAESKDREELERKSAESALSEKWHASPPPLPFLANYDIKDMEARGQKTIDTIYGPLLPSIFAGFGAHRADVAHMEVAHVYGLFLSDHGVLGAVEAEVVVLAAILCTGLRSPSLWHVRGLGRLLGARGADADNRVKDVLRGVKMAAIACVEFCGAEMEGRVKLSEWPNVGDVSRELGGFGDDAFEEAETEEIVGDGGGEKHEGNSQRYGYNQREEEREWAKEVRPGKGEVGENEAQKI